LDKADDPVDEKTLVKQMSESSMSTTVSNPLLSPQARLDGQNKEN